MPTPTPEALAQMLDDLLTADTVLLGVLPLEAIFGAGDGGLPDPRTTISFDPLDCGGGAVIASIRFPNRVCALADKPKETPHG